jgi:hypothetical protein
MRRKEKKKNGSADSTYLSAMAKPLASEVMLEDHPLPRYLIEFREMLS